MYEYEGQERGLGWRYKFWSYCVCMVKGDGITQRDNVGGEEIKTEAGATKTIKARGKLKRTTVTKGGECAEDRAMKETRDLPQRETCSIS